MTNPVSSVRKVSKETQKGVLRCLHFDGIWNQNRKRGKSSSKMFCADYVAAFVYHALFTIGSVNLVGKEVIMMTLVRIMIITMRI